MDLDDVDADRSTSESNEVEVIGTARPPPGISPFPGFRRGNLLRVEMKNFLTFSHTVIHPGPRMNVILGPNGTGKSTICNAVCIVFGGSPKILGRSTDLGNFVKHGQSKATIEALIYDPDRSSGVTKVSRTFDVDAKGHFFINDKKVKVSDINTINKRFDIQLDNLSQFMPQEKIAEFTQLKPDELLAITVRSLGGTEKEKLFSELCTLDQTTVQSKREMSNMEKTLTDYLRQHEAEAEEVEAFRKQQEAKKRLKLYQKCFPELQARELEEAYLRLLQERLDYKQALEDLKKKMSLADSGPVNACEQQLHAATEAFKSAKAKSREANERQNQLVTDTDDILLSLSEKTKQLQDVEAAAARRQKAVEQAEAKLTREESEMREHDDGVKQGDEATQLRELDEKRKKLRTEVRREGEKRDPWIQQRFEAARSITHFNEKLKNLADVRQIRIQEIAHKKRDRQIIACDRLVQNMKAKRAFRGDVRGPVCAEVEVNNDYHARVMESCLGNFIVSAFVTETAEDARLLLQTAKEELKWSPDIITAPTTVNGEIDIDAINSQVPNRPVDARLRELGIECVINDIYRSPPAVRAALNAQLGLHNIHVGTDVADRERGKLRNEDGMMAWYTPKSRCNILRSRYDSSVRNLKVDTQFASKSGSLFAGNSERSQYERNRIVTEIKENEAKRSHAGEQIKEIEARLEELRVATGEVDNSVRDVMKRRNERKQRLARYKHAKEHLEEVRRRAASTNVVKQREKLVEDIQRMEEEGAVSVMEATKSVVVLRDSIAQLDEKMAIRMDANRRLEAEKSKHVELQEQIEEKKEQYSKAKELAKKAKTHWKTKEGEAQEAFTEKERRENSELWAELEGKDVQWLEEQMARQEGRVAGFAGGEDAIQRYEHRQGKIDRLSEELRVKKAEHEKKFGQLMSDKREFLKWLHGGVQKMRVKFSELYRRLGCAGDLELVNQECDRIGDLELQILVSYRDDARLRPISASANSGGEKMCCTMLFCFSLLLEEERMPPFVFVDELNQGLDPSNEMKIMTMMFEDAEKDVAPQSFVISPKLLLNLPFHARTKTHIIFNGSVTGKMDIAAPQTT